MIDSQPMKSGGFELVRLAGGGFGVRSVCYGETMHPAGPATEAQALYVEQLRLPGRMSRMAGEFVIWDVGLGAAANVLTIFAATRHLPCPLRVISFDNTLEPLKFALTHADKLGYFTGYRQPVSELLSAGRVLFSNGVCSVEWTAQMASFPELISGPAGEDQPKPHAVLFDAYSPARNPGMWTLPLFVRLFELLRPDRPCALATYSRSTMLRVTLLLAGFFVGAGDAMGAKEETTIASNRLDMIGKPLDHRWLDRARASTGAEPLHEPVYRQASLTAETRRRLESHPQFR